MERDQVKLKADYIREVFHYRRRFKNSVFVIKIDSAITGHSGFPVLVRDLALLHENGIQIVIVPGARERIDDILNRFHLQWQFRDGTRITGEESIPFIKMAAFDVANKIMTSLSGSKVSAVIGNWVRARSKGVLGGRDFQSAGTVEKVDTAVITGILNQGLIPIFPCIGWNSLGKPYNISSDELAVFIAKSLRADKLFFVRAEPDYLSYITDKEREGIVYNNGRVSRLTSSAASALLAEIKNDTDRLLLQHAVDAAQSGVERIHILNGTIDGVILKEIFSNQGIGTLIHSDPYESIRPMRSKDIAEVLALMNPLIEKGNLIPRSREDLALSYKDYIVFEVDSTIHGCAAFFLLDDHSAEIAGLAVDQSFKHLGIGRQLVLYCIEQAKLKKLKQVFVFTTQSEDWFIQLGFAAANKEDLPATRNYDNKRMSKILKYAVTN